MGDPEPNYGFARQLERFLQAQHSEHRIQVINAAMTGIDSRVMVEIARGCQRAEGDFWVVYAGNNEVIGPFGAGTTFGRHPGMIGPTLALKSTRVGQLLEALARLGKEPPQWEGMEMFLGLQIARTDPRVADVSRNFAANLSAVVDLGRHAGAQVIVSTMPVNLRDSPPFASLHGHAFTDEEQVQWDALLARAAGAASEGRFREALSGYEEAAKLDPGYAELAFRRAGCWLRADEPANAFKDYQLARELDGLRFRATSPLNDVIRQTAGRKGVVLVDAEAECIRQAQDHIPGDDFFYDHVHLNFSGNYLVAKLVAAAINRTLANSISSGLTNVLSESEVARQLAFTEFDQRRVAGMMRARLEQPPFNRQSNFLERDERLRKGTEAFKSPLRECIQVYAAALSLDPDSWMLHANFAGLLDAAGESAAATAQWVEVTRLVPHYAPAWLNLGNLAVESKRFTEAEGYYGEARRQNANIVQLLCQLGLLASAQQRHGEAQNYFRRALQARPLPQWRGSIWRLNLPGNKTLWEPAPNIAKSSGATQAMWKRAAISECCWPDKNKSEAAKRLFEEVLEIRPGHAGAHYGLAQILTLQGQLADAVPHYEAAVNTRPEFFQAQLAFGLALAQLGRQSEALERLAEAVRLAPGSVDARFNYGTALANSHRYEEAAEQFQATVRLAPNHPLAARALENAHQAAAKRPGM